MEAIDAMLEALVRLESSHVESRPSPDAAVVVASGLRATSDLPPVLVARLEAAIGCDLVLQGRDATRLLAHAKGLDPIDRFEAGPAACAEAWRDQEPTVAPADPPRAPGRYVFEREAFASLGAGAAVGASHDGPEPLAGLFRAAGWSWYRGQTDAVGGGLALQTGADPALWAELRGLGWAWGASAGVGATVADPAPSVRVGVEVIGLRRLWLGSDAYGLEAWGRYDSGGAAAAGIAATFHLESRPASHCGTFRGVANAQWSEFRELSAAERRAWNHAAEAAAPRPALVTPFTEARDARAEACRLLQAGSDDAVALEAAIAADPWFRYVEGEAPPACVARHEALRAR